jgi:non-ribosomal peptide synthase protein (TIGR01720 family)
MSLSIEETRSLLQDLPQAYHTQINDALLTALARAFADWTGQDLLVVDLEGHGRDAIMEDVDISRTAGWFTTIFPVLLSLSDGSDVVQSLRAIKEQLRAIPNRGIGYGLLRHSSDDKEIVERLRAMPQAEVNFLYLGQFEQTSDASSTLMAAKESGGYARGPMGKRKHLIEVTGSVHGGQLHVNWTYSSAVHARETIDRLARKFMNELRAIITSCQAFEAATFTHSDFADYGWSQAELDDILTKISQSTESA